MASGERDNIPFPVVEFISNRCEMRFIHRCVIPHWQMFQEVWNLISETIMNRFYGCNSHVCVVSFPLILNYHEALTEVYFIEIYLFNTFNIVDFRTIDADVIIQISFDFFCLAMCCL